MATDKAEPDPMTGPDTAGAVTPPAGGAEEIGQTKARTLSPRSWNDAGLPLVERNTLPVTPRRRTRSAAMSTGVDAPDTNAVKPPSGSATPRAASAANRPLPAPIPAPPLSVAEPQISAVGRKEGAVLPTRETPAPITAPVQPQPPRRRWNLGVGALLCLGLLGAAYVATIAIPGIGGLGAPQNARPAPAANTSDKEGTSVGVSNEFAPAERQPGLPDTTLTPGEARPGDSLASDAAKIAAAPPPISAPTRQRVLDAYGITGADAERAVLIYLIPPSLNGTDAPANVLPVTPWFADLKSRLDRQLTQEVLDGKTTLADAQQELKTNWITAAHRHYVRNYGENKAEEARKIENRLNWEMSHPKSDLPESLIEAK
ncbi:MAG: hypothetical protein V4671_25740 [Armatimonadota bacterium]